MADAGKIFGRDVAQAWDALQSTVTGRREELIEKNKAKRNQIAQLEKAVNFAYERAESSRKVQTLSGRNQRNTAHIFLDCTCISACAFSLSLSLFSLWTRR